MALLNIFVHVVSALGIVPYQSKSRERNPYFNNLNRNYKCRAILNRLEMMMSCMPAHALRQLPFFRTLKRNLKIGCINSSGSRTYGWPVYFTADS